MLEYVFMWACLTCSSVLMCYLWYQIGRRKGIKEGLTQSELAWKHALVNAGLARWYMIYDAKKGMINGNGWSLRPEVTDLCCYRYSTGYQTMRSLL